MMEKRYYTVNEIVWDLVAKEPVLVKSLDIKGKTVDVEPVEKREGIVRLSRKRKLWEIDKYKPKATKKDRPKKKKAVLKFAKVREGAIIPSKRKEDAGYDFYASIEPQNMGEDGLVKELFIEKGTVKMIPTGIASSFDDDYVLNLRSERSSVGKHGVSVMAGVVDSGYRGEIMVMVTPLIKDLLISDGYDEVVVTDSLIIYPYTKAIAQGLLLPVPDVEVEEVSYEELKAIPSERSTGGWGSSNK